MQRYKVKWTENGITRYGIYRDPRHSPASAEGLVRVDDLIEGVYHEVPEADLVDVPRGTPETRYRDEADLWVEAQLAEAEARSDAIDGLGVGKMFTVGVADGCAFYVVTKVNKKTVDVEWRGYHPDRWTDQMMGFGGRFPRENIERFTGLAGVPAPPPLFGTSARAMR